ncbi:TetR/AcrR family transcriptional regulator [Streptomyces sp. CA-251247]|uniref:TetR/AcrR family transcriptional regulator n=1 Tax=Streptomyces sp. CA-251247 TaxID=3240062 RepID=UPI003D8BC88A
MTATADHPRTHGNRRGEGHLLRGEILTAAAELLDSGGDGRAVTLRAVARRAGIATTSIYPHFPDRQALVLAVAGQAVAGLSHRLRTADEAGGDARQRLHTVCRTYLDFAHRHPGRYRLMFAGLGRPIAAVDGEVTPDDPVNAGGEVMRILTAALTACAAAGQCTSSDPAADALALWLGLHGLAHQRAVAATFRWPADIAQRVVVTLARLGAV